MTAASSGAGPDPDLCPPGTPFATAVEALRTSEVPDIEATASGLVAQLTDAELLGLLDGDLTLVQAALSARKLMKTGKTPFSAGVVPRLGIPGLRFTDGPRGVTAVPATSFPVPIARAATFDPLLEEAIGAAIGAEARAAGANLVGAPCINLAPFPGWGRVQESYGEDPVLLGAMGAALSKGLQPWVFATVKHFAVNSMEEARFQVDVRVPDDVLHEVFLPHFRTVIEAGVDSVMSAYNSVNGVWAGESHHLLTEILRDEWGFTGFVHTDWIWGLRDPIGSVAAGQDVEMPFRALRAKTLPDALRTGRLRRDDVERSARRIVGAHLRLAVRAQPTPPSSVIASPRHRDLARDAARRGAVLLRNNAVEGAPMLPLVATDLKKVAVVGRLADAANQGDTGSSNVRQRSTVSIVEGLRTRLGAAVVTAPADADPAVAASVAGDADVAIVVVGLTTADEGEALVALDPDAVALVGGIARIRLVASALSKLLTFSTRWKTFGGDRRDLRLNASDIAVVRAVADANPRTVVVVIGGGTIVLDPWDAHVPALLLAWYPGMEGGHAITDVLLGDAEPTGRLPVVIPKRQADLPQVDWRARAVSYGRWWGQRKLDHDGVRAAYPFGFGLAYTTFETSDVEVGAVEGERFCVRALVRNTGGRTGRHVIQVYGQVPGSSSTRALLGFASVEVPHGAARDVEVVCSTRPLQRWTADGFVLAAGTIALEVGAHARDPRAIASSVTVGA
jgi:beta-glucosidase